MCISSFCQWHLLWHLPSEPEMCGVFTSDVHLCLAVGDTVVRRGERPLRRHFRD